MPISTHILDTARGVPAAHISITLEYSPVPESWQVINSAYTNHDGRAPQLTPPGHVLATGTYRLTFHTAPYFAALGTETFYPLVQIQFTIRDPHQHYHVPLLLSPFGYSTYRGS